MGFPFAGGWAEQPWWITEIITLFENAFNAEQNAKYDKSDSTSNSNTKYNTDKFKSLNDG